MFIFVVQIYYPYSAFLKESSGGGNSPVASVVLWSQLSGFLQELAYVGNV